MKLSESTWSPFQSPEVREICANLTPAEHARLLDDARQRGTEIGLWIAGPAGIVAALVVFSWGFGGWQLAGVPLVAFAIYIAVWRRRRERAMRRRSMQLLCETEWARSHNYTPERLRVMKFPWSK